jgi:hypothetical protein
LIDYPPSNIPETCPYHFNDLFWCQKLTLIS